MDPFSIAGGAGGISGTSSSGVGGDTFASDFNVTTGGGSGVDAGVLALAASVLLVGFFIASKK